MIHRANTRNLNQSFMSTVMKPFCKDQEKKQIQKKRSRSMLPKIIINSRDIERSPQGVMMRDDSDLKRVMRQMNEVEKVK